MYGFQSEYYFLSVHKLNFILIIISNGYRVVWPRDLCYVRYWRRNDDGSYGILISSLLKLRVWKLVLYIACWLLISLFL